MRAFAVAIFSALVALASALAPTKPNYNLPPSGNPIYTPGLDQAVPEGKPFNITWGPTTTGNISLYLLHGPGNNVKVIATLAEDIPNSGSFEWTPSTALTPEPTHYGLLLVVQGTGQYQYSTQFGLSKSMAQKNGTAPVSSMGSSSASASASAPTGSSSAPATLVTQVTVVTTTFCPLSATGTGVTATGTSAPTSVAAATAPAFTGAAGRNAVSISLGAAAAGVAALLAL